MSDSLQPHGVWHIRLPCPSLSPRVCSNSCPLHQWCYLTILSSAAFNLSQHHSLSQRVGSLYQGAKALEPQLQHQSFPVNIQDWFPLGLTGLISLLSKGLSRVFFSTTVWKHQFFGAQTSLWASLVTQRLKCLPAMQETWVRSLDQKVPLEKEMSTHSICHFYLAWKILWMEEPFFSFFLFLFCSTC